MKVIYLFSIAIVAISFTACDFDFDDFEGGSGIVGDGNVVKKDREIGSFSKISAATGLDVYVTMGSSESLSIEADENIHEKIMTEIEGNTLKVYIKGGLRKASKKSIFITADDLEGISASSGANVEVQNPVSATNMVLDASSGSDIEVTELNATTCSVDVSSGADVDVNAGSAEELTLDISSGSDFNGKNFLVKKCNAELSSSGDATINVSDELTYDGSSGSTLRYIGKPTMSIDVSSGAKIKDISGNVQ